MTEYSKLKVTELKELLSQRELPTTGKKEELISRLNADDAAKAVETANGASEPAAETSTVAPAAPTLVDKEVKDITAPPAAPAEAPIAEAPVQGEKKKFTFKRLADEFDAPTTSEAPSVPKVEEPKAAEPAESFSAGLATTDADSELEKRKKRAARFGVPVSDSIKLMERAKRFGGENSGESSSGDKALTALDSALGENRGKKRGPETRIQNEPPKKSKDSSKPAAASKGVLSDPSEKAKAEARAKRFGGS
ncbi:hypothetical protein ABW19_dt0203350 [Dactylella cylindrospora]|nr:hypothetical protein ABW19_dt0203350 [Dactylella cylindrospora]